MASTQGEGMFRLRGCEMMNYTIMFLFIVLLTIISLYIMDSYKPRSFCLAKDVYIDSKELKAHKRIKRRYFKADDKHFLIKILFNYIIVLLSLIILFTVYIKSNYFFEYKSFLELVSGGNLNLIISFAFFLIMFLSPILAIIITVRTAILIIEAYTTTIKLEKNHLVYNNKFRTINIFFNKDKHSISIEKGYIKGILGKRSNVIYYKIIFDFINEKRELKLYGFNEKDVIDLKNNIFLIN